MRPDLLTSPSCPRRLAIRLIVRNRVLLLSGQAMSNIAGGCHDVFYIWVGMLVRVRHADIHPAERWLSQRAIGLR